MSLDNKAGDEYCEAVKNLIDPLEPEDSLQVLAAVMIVVSDLDLRVCVEALRLVAEGMAALDHDDDRGLLN